MKILAVSDQIEPLFFNSGLKRPEKIEAILACGDLPPLLPGTSGKRLECTPVLGIHDEPTRVQKGFKALRLFVEQYRPAYHIHGHTMVQKNIYKTRYRLTRIVNVNPWQILDI